MLSLQSTASFAQNAQSELELRSFYAPEDDFAWSTGKWCELRFDFALPPPRGRMPLELLLDADVYRSETAESQNILVYLNGLRIGSFLVFSRGVLTATMDISTLRSMSNVLTIDTPDARSPSDDGDNDGRVLGIKVYSLQIRPAV